jgi:50S ribosomal subunit-associated GTPase HflX
MEQLDEVKDQVEESLDVLDFVYGRIYDKSQIEVLSDEPLVRELLQDIKAAKDTMIIVANKIVLPLSEDEDEE